MKVTSIDFDLLIFSNKVKNSNEDEIKNKIFALKQELNELNKKKNYLAKIKSV